MGISGREAFPERYFGRDIRLLRKWEAAAHAQFKCNKRKGPTSLYGCLGWGKCNKKWIMTGKLIKHDKDTDYALLDDTCQSRVGPVRIIIYRERSVSHAIWFLSAGITCSNFPPYILHEGGSPNLNRMLKEPNAGRLFFHRIRDAGT